MPAATGGFVGKGTILGYATGTTPPYTYTTMALVVSVSPNLSLGETENIVLASTFKSYLATLPEGEADFTVQHAQGDPGVTEILSILQAGTIIHWQIKTPDGATCSWDGFLKGYNPTFENESVVLADCSMRMTTFPVFAAS